MGTRAPRGMVVVAAILTVTLGWAAAQEPAAPAPQQPQEPQRPQPLVRPPQVQPQPATPVVPEGPQPRLELGETVFDMGEVWQGTPAVKEFTASNRGEAPLTLVVRASCGCTVISQPKSPLAPGESTTFTVSYRTDTTLGPANKRVTVTTNDPLQAAVNIDIKGHVKALFEVRAALPAAPATDGPGAVQPVAAQAHIGRGISFRNAEKDMVAEEKVFLTSNYDKPVHLRLHEPQNFGRFEVRLREVEPGKTYELSARTLPPLNIGANYLNVVLETGVELLPQFTVPITATVMPRVQVTPQQILVNSTMDREMQRVMQVRYKRDQPFEILEIESSLDVIKIEALPSPTLAGEWSLQQLRVTLPPFAAIPEDGATITIHTSDTGEFKTLTVPVRRQVVAAAAGRRLGPGGVIMPPSSPQPPQAQPGAQQPQPQPQPAGSEPAASEPGAKPAAVENMNRE